MKGRELAMTLGIIYDKRNIMRTNASSSSHGIDSTPNHEKLAMLERKFNDFAATLRGETINVEVVKETDLEVVND